MKINRPVEKIRHEVEVEIKLEGDEALEENRAHLFARPFSLPDSFHLQARSLRPPILCDSTIEQSAHR